MAAPKISEADFIALFREAGQRGVSKKTGQTERSVLTRRRDIERRLGITIDAPKNHKEPIHYEPRVALNVRDGVVLVGSDLHAWPGDDPPAFRALIAFIRQMKPAAVVMNGDVIDGASISRHPPIGWEKQPQLIEELEAAQEMLHRIEKVAPRACRLVWPLGNHDARFSTRLATVAPEYAKVHGVRLQDHFGSRWEPCWSAWVNPDSEQPVVVKHRHKGGIHSTHNSTLWAGLTTVCGHLHALRVTPLTDYRVTRFGVDAGCLASRKSAAFGYLEDSPVNWREGFVVLTFVGGKLLWPEVVHVLDETHVEFRGAILEVPMTDDDVDVPQEYVGGGPIATKPHRAARPKRERKAKPRKRKSHAA